MGLKKGWSFEFFFDNAIWEFQYEFCVGLDLFRVRRTEEEGDVDADKEKAGENATTFSFRLFTFFFYVPFTTVCDLSTL